MREKLDTVKQKAKEKRLEMSRKKNEKRSALKEDCPLPNVIRVESTSSSNLPEIWRARRQNLEKCLRNEFVSREKLRETVADGFVPDQPSSVRYDVWSYLLRLVPEDKKERESERIKKRETYEQFVEELASSACERRT